MNTEHSLAIGTVIKRAWQGVVRKGKIGGSGLSRSQLCRRSLQLSIHPHLRQLFNQSSISPPLVFHFLFAFRPLFSFLSFTLLPFVFILSTVFFTSKIFSCRYLGNRPIQSRAMDCVWKRWGEKRSLLAVPWIMPRQPLVAFPWAVVCILSDTQCAKARSITRRHLTRPKMLAKFCIKTKKEWTHYWKSDLRSGRD